jgi:PAS domain S-box-containing protein
MIRPWISPPKNLGVQLLTLYLLIIIPALAILFAFDYIAGERIQADVKANDLSLAHAIAFETDLSIGKSLQAVNALSQYESVKKADLSGMEEIFDIFIQTRPDVNLIYRLDANGIMLYHYPEGPGSTVGKDFSFRDYYQKARNGKNALVSKGRISPTTNQAVATAVMPVWDKQEFLGIIATNIKLASLSETLSEIISNRHLEEGFDIVIIDADAQIIAYPDSRFLLENAATILPPVYTNALAGKSGTQILANETGKNQLYTYAPIPSAGWAVIISRPTESAFSTQITIHHITLIVSATFISFGLLIWLLLAKRVVTPIESLSSLSRAIGSEEGISATERKKIEALSKRPDQIGYLTQSILRMEQSIATRINEQKTLLETSKAVVSTLDPQVVLDRILKQVQKLFNVNMCAIVALDEEKNAFRIRASRGLSQEYAAQIIIQPTDPNSITMRALEAKEPLQISDTKKDLSFSSRLPLAEAEGYRSLLAVPLNTQHTPPAALLVFRPNPHVFTKNEIQLLVNFANHVTMAIENATLYSRSDTRLQEQTHRIEALVHSLSDGLILSALGGGVIYANRRIGELANLTAEELTHTSVDTIIKRILLNAPNRDEIQEKIEEALTGPKEREINIPIISYGGRIYLRLQIFDVTDTGGKSIGRGLIFRDVTADQEVDRMKSSLISTVSHELRTPLASIKGYATTLLAEDVEWDDTSQREFLTIISEETDRLSKLVNDLLDLSRIESGNLSLTHVACNIRDLIQSAAKRAHLQEGNRLEINLDPNLPTLYADPPRLKTTLRNLIENAVKYAGEKALIQVEVLYENGYFIFRVKDDGPGIPQKENERIFQSFYRVDTSLTRTSSGAGLGLAICQGLIQAHGGEIWTEPQQKGACIAFSIPLSDPGITLSVENEN